MEKKVGFIGIGNMAGAIASSLLREHEDIASQVYIANRNVEKAEKFAQEHGANSCRTNREVVEVSDIIFLGVKPHILGQVLTEIKEAVSDDKILVSMAAGVSLDDIGGYFPEKKKIIRIMPNVCAQVNEGVITLAANEAVSENEKREIIALLASSSLVDEVDEGLIEVATILSGASPAYIAMFAEALADGGVQAGLPRSASYKYVAQTLIGTGRMILEGKHPAEIKDMVCSPAGITIQGVSYLEERNFRSLVMNLVTELKVDEPDVKE